MKRFHVHVHVSDLAHSVGFYSRLFGAAPTREESDYAKWMLEDPPVNFAISTRGATPGLDHFGFQVEDAQELGELKARAEAADLALLDEGSTTCCYARSEKHWVVDPQGIAWEHFHTLGDIPVFREGESEGGAQAGACCTPAATPAPASAASPCCGTGSAKAEASAVANPTTRGKPLGIPVKSSGSTCC